MSPARTPKFLIVEDDDVDREAMQRGFAAAGAADVLVMASDGLEALEILRDREPGKRHDPLIIISDLNMPRMSGTELLAELRADPQLAPATVFVCTTSNSETDRERAFSYNIAGYISKSKVGTQWDRVAKMLLEYWELTEQPTD